MKYKRAQLLQHLQRLYCGGQITEAVFTGAFATQALTPDQQLFVVAPPLPKARVIAKKGETVGVAELMKMMKALAVLSGTGNEAVDVDLTVEDHRLVLTEEGRGILRVMTAQPKTISTWCAPDIATQVLKKSPKLENGISLTRVLVEGLRATFSLFKAEEIEIFVGPAGGKIRVGGEDSDTAEFAPEGLVASTQYSLLFGQHFVDVLSTITNYSEAMLYLGGPEASVLVTDGDYQYLLSPRVKSADA